MNYEESEDVRLEKAYSFFFFLPDAINVRIITASVDRGYKTTPLLQLISSAVRGYFIQI